MSDINPQTKIVLELLMPISLSWQDLKSRHENFDHPSPKVLTDIVEFLHDTSVYIDGVYRQLGVTQEEWDAVYAIINPLMETKHVESDSADGATGERQDHMGEEGTGEESGQVLPDKQGRPQGDDASGEMEQSEREAGSGGEGQHNDKGFEGRPARNHRRHEPESDTPREDTGGGGSPVPNR